MQNMGFDYLGTRNGAVFFIKMRNLGERGRKEKSEGKAKLNGLIFSCTQLKYQTITVHMLILLLVISYTG